MHIELRQISFHLARLRAAQVATIKVMPLR